MTGITPFGLLCTGGVVGLPLAQVLSRHLMYLHPLIEASSRHRLGMDWQRGSKTLRCITRTRFEDTVMFSDFEAPTARLRTM